MDGLRLEDPPARAFAVAEAERRKPGGRFEAPVTLADGQRWWLSRPRVRLAPSDDDGGFRVVLLVEGLEGYQGLVDALLSADSTESVVRAEMALAKALVLRNYELSAGELFRLVQFSYMAEGEDPEGEAVRREVMAVATGNATTQ